MERSVTVLNSYCNSLSHYAPEKQKDFLFDMFNGLGLCDTYGAKDSEKIIDFIMIDIYDLPLGLEIVLKEFDIDNEAELKLKQLTLEELLDISFTYMAENFYHPDLSSLKYHNTINCIKELLF